LEKSTKDLVEVKENEATLFEAYFDRSKTYPEYAKWVAACGGA
jgi:hypothetical protein